MGRVQTVHRPLVPPCFIALDVRHKLKCETMMNRVAGSWTAVWFVWSTLAATRYVGLMSWRIASHSTTLSTTISTLTVSTCFSSVSDQSLVSSLWTSDSCKPSGIVVYIFHVNLASTVEAVGCPMNILRVWFIDGMQCCECDLLFELINLKVTPLTPTVVIWV